MKIEVNTVAKQTQISKFFCFQREDTNICKAAVSVKTLTLFGGF